MKSLSVIHVVPFIDDEASGPAASVVGLCKSLHQHRIDTSLHALSPLPKIETEFSIFGHSCSRLPHPSLGRSPAMLRALVSASKQAEIIHNHSLWMSPNIYAERARRGNLCRLVVSPRGTLATWALNRSRFKKRISWWMGQKNGLMNADLLHATGEKEYEEIRQFGLKQPVVIIPNGVDIPNLPETRKESIRGTLMFFGRIHPVKGVENLLRAWGCLQGQYPKWDLKIVGPDHTSYANLMKKLTYDLRLQRVEFTGKLCGQSKWQALYDASLLVLPSYTENFGMVVAEAMACGVPVITTKGTPWSGLQSRKAGWWIEQGVNPLCQCLHEAMRLSPSDLYEMGKRGRKWMIDEFSWFDVGRKMKLSYEWLVRGSDKPDCVVLD